MRCEKKRKEEKKVFIQDGSARRNKYSKSGHGDLHQAHTDKKAGKKKKRQSALLSLSFFIMTEYARAGASAI